MVVVGVLFVYWEHYCDLDTVFVMADLNEYPGGMLLLLGSYENLDDGSY
jgi:hypothetical protein